MNYCSESQIQLALLCENITVLTIVLLDESSFNESYDDLILTHTHTHTLHGHLNMNNHMDEHKAD